MTDDAKSKKTMESMERWIKDKIKYTGLMPSLALVDSKQFEWNPCFDWQSDNLPKDALRGYYGRCYLKLHNTAPIKPRHNRCVKYIEKIKQKFNLKQR